MADITVTGIHELQAQLDKLTDLGAVIGYALLDSGAEVMTWTKEYPASSEANRPRARGGWYERGRGQMYANRAGQVRVVKSSEMLNRSWSLRHTFSPNLAEVVIGTRGVSYAHYVHDEAKQARFHKARGWRTAQDAVRKFERGIVKRVEDAITRAIGA